MKAAAWIDRVKAAKGWESDYRAAKELGLSRQAVSGYRNEKYTLDEDSSLKVALALEIDPLEVLADQAMERSKSDAARSAWAGVLGRFNVGKQKTPTPSGVGVQAVGGNGGIRTLDEALHPILP